MVTRHDLINEDSGKVNLWALKALARREALLTWGAISPRSLRISIREISGLLPDLKCAWRQRHGLPIESVQVVPFGRARDCVRRSAF